MGKTKPPKKPKKSPKKPSPARSSPPKETSLPSVPDVAPVVNASASQSPCSPPTTNAQSIVDLTDLAIPENLDLSLALVALDPKSSTP